MNLLNVLRLVGRRLLGKRSSPRVIAIHPFDAESGTDTSGLMDGKKLQTEHPNDRFITAYFGVPPSRFLNAIERWQATPGAVDFQECRFIDVGCGKGRAVMLASSLPFRDVVGVELNASLVAVAQANLQHWQATHPSVPAQIYLGDGPTVVRNLLDGPSLIYLYNPFRAPVLRELLAAIIDSQRHLPAPLDLLYLYPEYQEVFSEFQDFQLLWRADIPLATEDEGDGISAATDPCCLYRFVRTPHANSS